MRIITNRLQFFMLILLIAISAFVYGNTTETPFYLDDGVNIVENPFVRLTNLSPEQLNLLVFESPCPKRPLANISFGLNYLFDQYKPSGYHIVNIIVHIANGILLYFFLIATLRVSPGGWWHERASAVAFFTALLWLVHPLQTQSVTYIVQRMNSMSALFYLGSLVSYIKGRRAIEDYKKWFWFLACIVSWILALGSKEIAAFLPFVIFLYEWFFFQHRSISWIRRTIWPLVGTIIVLSFVVLVYTGFEPFRSVLSGYSHRDFTLLQRVLTQFRVIPYYIGLIVYPHPSRLSLLHDFDISSSLLDPPSTIICAAGITLAVLSACWMSKKEPLLAFAIFWFFGNLVIESSVVGLEIIFEHRTYLPSMLVSFLIVMLSFRYIGNTILVTALLCVVVGIFSLWTYERNALWNDKVAFWEDCSEKAANDVRVHHNLGNAYLETDRLDDAMKAYERALNVDPTFTKSLVGLGHALREKGEIVRAIAAHKKAIERAPRDSSSYDHLGADYIETNKMNLAIQALKKAIDLGPYNYRAYNNLGFAYSKTGDVSKAVTMYEQSIAIRPDFAAAYNNLGVLFLNPAESKKAVKVLRKALEIDPGYADAYSNMGLALIYGGNFKKGIRLIKVALELESDHQDATFNLARAYELLGDYHSAVDQYKNSIRLNPRDVDAHFNAGFIYLNHLLNDKKALILLKQGLSIDSSHKKATVVKEAIYQLENTNQNAT